MSALALSFVLGLQYMVAPGTEEMQHADFRSLVCKSQERGSLGREKLSIWGSLLVFKYSSSLSQYVMFV